MPHEPVCGDPRHDVVRVVYPFASLIPQRERKRLRDFIGGGGTEPVWV